MNYIWEAVLAAEESGIHKADLHFVPAKAPSPYVEVSFADLNITELAEKLVEVNPLYRFGSVFEEIFGPDNREYEKLREIFLDVFLHYAAEADLLSGMNRQEYYFRILNRELSDGTFGRRAAEAMKLFDKKERRLIVTSLLGLYRSGHYEEIFRQLIRGLYEDSIIYLGRDKADAIYLYLGKRETERERKRIGFLTDTFLALNKDVKIYYDKHFGILDVDETMQMDRILLI